ncbi:MAG: dihydrofolate reductase family protein [Actinomycetota bacterium]
MRVVVSEFLTFDGVMQAPGGADEDRTGGFEHGGWQGSYWDDAAGKDVDEGLARTGGLLLGRRTYDIFAAYWPNPTDPEDAAAAHILNGLPKYVVSTTLEEPLEWENSTLIKGDVPGEVAKLKERPGEDLRVFGSGELAQTLLQHGLVDEYQLQVNPIVLGSGRRLFRDGGPRIPLELTDSTVTSTGVLILKYRPAESGG